MDAALAPDPFADGRNPFDDLPPSGAPPAGARPLTITPAPRSAAPPPADPFANGRNPFDDDDAPAVGASAASASAPGPLSNNPGGDSYLSSVAKGVGTTAIKGLAHLPGFAGDMRDFADALMELPEYVESRITGQPFADVVAKRKALGEAARAKVASDTRGVLGFSLPDPSTVVPSGAQIAAPVLARTGEYQPSSIGGRYASAAGEAAIGGLGMGGAKLAEGAARAAPGVFAGIRNMIGGGIEHALPNAAAGVASQGAADATGGEPLAASLAGIGVTGIPSAAAAAHARMIQGRAARTLATGTSDPAAALAAVDAAIGGANVIPGYQPTTAQVTRDPGITGMQSAAADTKARGPQFDARRQQQNRALGSALDMLSAENVGDPGKVATAFQQHFDDIGERTQALIDGHLATAQAHADALRGRGLPTDAVGAELQNGLIDAYHERTRAEGALHDIVDPDGTLTADASGVKAAAAQLYGNLPVADRQFMSPDEHTFRGLIDSLPDVSSYRELAALKSNMAAAQSSAKNGQTTAERKSYGRLTALMGPLQDAIKGKVAQRAAADNAAVAASTMAPENTLEAFLRSGIASADPRRDAGADVGARAVGTGAGASSPSNSVAGAERAQGRLLGAAGAAGVPGNE